METIHLAWETELPLFQEISSNLLWDITSRGKGCWNFPSLSFFCLFASLLYNLFIKALVSLKYRFKEVFFNILYCLYWCVFLKWYIIYTNYLIIAKLSHIIIGFVCFFFVFFLGGGGSKFCIQSQWKTWISRNKVISDVLSSLSAFSIDALKTNLPIKHMLL